MLDFFSKLFDTQDFPARWHCGQWTPGHGWLHIASDLAIFGAYMTIPIILVWFVSRRKDLPFPRVFWLFAAFILFCGVTHLNEAIIFWKPAYRWAGLLKFGTAVVSWATVVALAPVVRQALTLKTQGQVEREVATRTVQLEERAETEAERFANLVANSEDAILTQDGEGRILSWNPGAERMYGYTAQEAIGQSIEFIIPPDRRAEHQALMADMLARQAAFRVRTRRRTKAGVDLDVSLTVSPLRNRAGDVVGASTIARDVTEQVQAEETLERRVAERTEELARSNADLEQFAYVASHDLKEPLRMVSSYCGLIQEECEGVLSPEAKTYLEFAVGGATRMQDLLSDLLAYSRVGSHGGHFISTSSAEVLQAVRDDLQLAIEEAGAKITVAPDLPQVHADPSQLRQLFQNLIANAIRFSGDAPPEIHVSAEETPDGWRFAVADKGIGIDMKQAERIFTIFKRLNPRAYPDGTGIGLAIAKRIVERHQGQIWVESTLGEGATFYVQLGKPD